MLRAAWHDGDDTTSPGPGWSGRGGGGGGGGGGGDDDGGGGVVGVMAPGVTTSEAPTTSAPPGAAQGAGAGSNGTFTRCWRPVVTCTLRPVARGRTWVFAVIVTSIYVTCLHHRCFCLPCCRFGRRIDRGGGAASQGRVGAVHAAVRRGGLRHAASYPSNVSIIPRGGRVFGGVCVCLSVSLSLSVCK
jgi:hypothetical protein